MTISHSNPVIAAVCFVLVLISGYWVSRSGKPINQARMNVHKFIALGTAIFIGVILFQVLEGQKWTALETGMVIASGVVALAARLTGGLTSLAQTIPGAAFLHEVNPTWLCSSQLSCYSLLGDRYRNRK